MKKTFLFLAFFAAILTASAQDYTKIALSYQLKKYEDAKKDIDKMATDAKAKDKAETYLWQAAIYGQMYGDSAMSAKYPGSDKLSYDAFQTYKQKDPSLKLLKEGTSAAALNGIFYLYSGSFNNGKKYFTESKWPESYENFKRAAELSEFITKNGFNSASKTGIDTITVLYTGYAAQNMQKPEDAVVYYEKLADLKTGGADLQEMYRLMLIDYATLKQADKFTKYLATAKELYPSQSALWSQLEMGNMSQNSSVDEIMAKYKEAESGTLTEEQLENFAQSFANQQTLQNMDSAKQIEYRLTAAQIYKRAFNQNGSQGIYAYNAGLLNYNIFNSLDEKYYNLRGEGAALKAQRGEVEKQQQVYADSSIMWLEKGYNVLKAKTTRDKLESNSLNRTVDMLANLYMWKRDKTKGSTTATSNKDYDKYDAKFQQLDKEHDMYKM